MCSRHWKPLRCLPHRMCYCPRSTKLILRNYPPRIRFNWNLLFPLFRSRRFNFCLLVFFYLFFLGNLSNPCINRWGINAFWSHYWYTDTKYSLFLQQDVMMSVLLKTYIHYGSRNPPRFWQDQYWHKTKNYTSKCDLHHDNRWFVKHEIDLGYSVAYIMRNEGPELFEARWNILRFNRWFVINVSWFQPDKTKNKRKKRSNVFHQLVTSYNPKSQFYKNKRLLIRFNTLITTQLLKTSSRSSSYIF